MRGGEFEASRSRLYLSLLFHAFFCRKTFDFQPEHVQTVYAGRALLDFAQLELVHLLDGFASLHERPTILLLFFELVVYLHERPGWSENLVKQ